MQIAARQSMESAAAHLGLRHSAIMSSYLNGGLPLNGSSASTAFPPRTSPASMSSRSDEEVTTQKRSRDSSKDLSSPMPQDYKCPLCHITLANQKEFTSHIRGHNEVKPSPDPNDPTGQAKVYYCCLCGKMLSSFSSLDRHMLVHSGERPFSCERCGQTFTTNGNMHRHKRTHGARDSRESDGSSGTSSNGGQQRGRVGRKRKTSLEQPASAISSLASISTPPSSVSLASPIESSKLLLQQFNNKKNEVRNILGLSSVGNLPSPVPSGHAKCPVCHETFFSEISLAAHVDSAHRGQDIKCDECSNVFPGYSYLKLHKNIYHHKSLASFPLHALQQGLAGFPSMLTSTPTPLKIESQIETKEKAAEPKKEEKILDLSSPIKISKSIFNTSTDDLSNNASSEYDQDYDKEFDDNEDLIRDMKLKGEFPCRICPAVYPNLRALKGHNKEHMDKPPYICNVAKCEYASNDKSTLARHMRTHTGEKPFECTLCNFGFTTKANCERHIKNKHGKLSREEVRDAIVVHEISDDKMSVSGDRNMMNTSMTESNISNSSFRDESPSASPTKKRRKSGSISADKKTPLTLFAPYHSSLFRPALEEKKIDHHDDAPLDLSRPVNDFIKEDTKKNVKKDIPTEMPLPASFPTKMMNGTSPSMDFTKSLAAAVSAASFQGLHNQMPFPFLFSHFANAAAAGQFDITAYILAQQEAIRRQRELEAAAAATAAMAPKDPTGLLLHLSNLQSLSSRNFVTDVTALPSNTVTPTPLSAPSPPENRPFSYFSESNKERSDSESDYKMVIKNGVLMKKQKQRRYRTERPYECEKCSARFTLRSNMERHVKQQHAGGPNDLSNTGINNGKDSEMYQREDDDRDEMEDSENEDGGVNSNKMHEDEDEEEINVHDDEEEEEEEGVDLSSLEQLVKVNGSTKPFHTFFDTTEDEDESEGELNSNGERKLSAYSAAPNKIPCPFCGRIFPWTSSLKRHILTHTGDKPYKCPECPLWFTTKSNCDRHLVRKHSNNNNDVLGMRNIPERPYKCQMCPSSTFSSQSNLRKHQHTKHRVNNGDNFSSSSSNEDEDNTVLAKEEESHNDSKESASSGLSETPFKCHLCEDGFGERDEAIAHLQNTHTDSYQILMAKGAFDLDAQQQQPHQNFSCEEENFEQLRGKFPDYVNRKVICMFCNRKFWSAEDLRRHVRTHTGERPYSCDICQRTFTLKHSMLRHRKKHDSGVSSGGEVSESESESAEVRSAYTSSVGGGRSSPEEEAAKAARLSHPAVNGSNIKTDIKKKRANLMDKINQLTSSVNHNDPSMLSQNIPAK